MNPKQRISAIHKKLISLGPMLPGSISEQWNVCGTPGCVCKAKENPVKHGPYYQLSFSVKGRSSTMFIKPENLADAKRMVARYKKFKELCFELIQANVDLVRENGFKGKE
ncbi:MAG: hypothetical protein GX556_18900 [Fibrobacter sp.]|nr:hypothetical protein [Fibrobacter sp.]